MRYCLLILLFPFGLLGQQKFTDDWAISTRIKSGFLAAHRGTMGHLAKDRIFAGELSFSRRMRSKCWSHEYRNPYVGATLYGSNLGNKAILGYGYGVYGFIEFPWTRSEKHVFTCKVGAGLGVVTKIFDQETNPKNVATSTHMNALICLGLQGRWYMKDGHALLYGMDMTHFSNGSSRVPNLGLNMPYLTLGYEFRIKKQEREIQQMAQFQRLPFIKGWTFSTVGIVSMKEIFPTEGKKYPVFALSGIAFKQFKPKVGVEMALDIISKQSIFGYRKYIEKSQWKILQVGAFLGYSIPLDRFRFVIGMGVYLKDRYDQDNELYHRVGMRYQFDNGLLLNLVLKTHWAKADYVEYGIGYSFKHKRRYHEN